MAIDTLISDSKDTLAIAAWADALSEIDPLTLKTLVVIDTGLQNYTELIEGIVPQAAVLLLDTQDDGITQISQFLTSHRHITDLYLLAHGRPGHLQLGSTDLSLDTLPHYEAVLKDWAIALAQKATLHLYACNVAQGEDGRAFVNQLSRVTGANLAAATHTIGHARFGGSWQLDYTLGTIGPVSPFVPGALEAYVGTLALTQSNGTVINIPSSGTADVYPSTIVLAGLRGSISGIQVNLLNVNHTFPNDIDILLVSPGGQSVVLMSDVGGSTDLVNTSLFLSDSALQSLPSSNITSGVYKPTNVGAGDPFPAPALPGPHGSQLSSFVGTNPNGTWRLFVVDDVSSDLGSIANGWQLVLTLTPVIDLNGPSGGLNFATTFVEDAGPVSVADSTALTVVDDDSPGLESATVVITNLQDGSLETLSADTSGTGIGASYDPLTGSLSLTGNASLASYQQVLRNVRYNNAAPEPGLSPRVIQFVLNDGSSTSAIATSTVAITAVNNDDESFVTTAATDLLDAAEGNDRILSTAANLQQNDLLDGGTGLDTLVLTGSLPGVNLVINVDSALTQVGIPGTTVRNVERFDLGGFVGRATMFGSNSLNDELIGSAGANIINGNGGNDSLSGNSGKDRISGGTGNDAITGGAGIDRLTGGTGKDSFVLTSKLTGARDVITDFVTRDDKIVVSKAGFGNTLKLGVLGQRAFVLGTSALDQGDRFIYNQSTGSLFFDADGIGSSQQVLVAQLLTKPTLRNTNLIIVA